MIWFVLILVCGRLFLPDTRKNFFFRRNNLCAEKKTGGQIKGMGYNFIKQVSDYVALE